MQRLQVQLLGRLGRDELHRRPLHRLGDRLRVAEVVLLSLRISANVLRRHQSDIMPERVEFPAQMMRTNASLHTDQARRQVGEPRCYLTARPLLAKCDRTTPVEANHVEGVLADINADYGDCDPRLLSRERAPCLWRPWPASSAGGAGARPDHSITGPWPSGICAAYICRTVCQFRLVHFPVLMA